MAETKEGDALTQAFRAGQIKISKETEKKLLAVWPLLDITDIDGTVATWLNAATQLVIEGRAKSIELAIKYLKAFFMVEVGAVPAEVPIVIDDDTVVAIRTSLEVTGPAQIKRMTAAGYPLEHSSKTALSGVLGSASRHVEDGGRDAVLEVSKASPQSAGRWRRVTVGDTCSFCSMLAGRGSVYSAETSRFSSHDFCDCVAEPAFDDGTQLKVHQYTASKRNISDAEKQRLREYLGADTPSNVTKALEKPAFSTSYDDQLSLSKLEEVRDALIESEAKFHSDWNVSRIADLNRKIAARK